MHDRSEEKLEVALLSLNWLFCFLTAAIVNIVFGVIRIPELLTVFPFFEISSNLNP